MFAYGFALTSESDSALTLRSVRRVAYWSVLITVLFIARLQALAADTVYRIKPSTADPRVSRFDDANLIMFAAGGSQQRLFVYLPGTGGKPSSGSALLNVATRSGYRAISLEYDNIPSVSEACFDNSSPNCAAEVREKRVFGVDDTRLIDDLPAESIVQRLSSLLRRLAQDHPGEYWNKYLGSSDSPAWSRIVICGHSQGGGMAEYIAKRKSVARVVIFSGGWDGASQRFDSPGSRLAPWYAGISMTSSTRWYGAYHLKEKYARLIAESYQVLGIPAANTRILDGPTGVDGAFHATIIRDPVYLPDWRFLIGQSP